MNIFADFARIVRGELDALAAEGALPPGLDTSRLVVEPPRERAHGDVTTNAAMVLAKQAGKPPRAIAGLLAARLGMLPEVTKVEIAGPGFVNLTLAAAFWPKGGAAVLQAGERFGGSTMGAGRKVNVEYVSANPTGPLHVGHCRGAVFGDALANLFERAGYGVTREYYINDAGAQVDVLARSAYLRYREALGEAIGAIPAGLYPGDYLKPVGEALAREHGAALLGQAEAAWLPVVRARAIAMMLDTIREDLAALGIRQEVFTSEQALHASGGVAATLDDLKQRGLVYVGRLPPPKGEAPEDWEDRDQTLFRTTAYGDDIDRPLLKSDGSYTYFASDVAYARDKVNRGFSRLVYVLGADHGGYVKRLEAVVSALSGGAAAADVKLCQLVKLFRGGEPVKMSKRAGEFVTLRDVVDEVGPDVVRFIMLYRKNDAPLDFDFQRVTEQSRDNPVFYVQYAHARICSVLRHAQAEVGDGIAAAERLPPDRLSILADPAEIEVMRRLADYPRLVEAAASASEPHRIAFYLYDLASEFHALWNKGKESPHLRFIVADDRGMTVARLAFLRAIRYVLGNGLGILGVRPVDEM